MVRLSLACALLFSVAARPAFAQSGSNDVMVPGVGVMTAAQLNDQIAELEEKRDSIKLSGPRAGVATTAILVAGGVTTAVLGAIVNRTFCFSDETICRNAEGNTLVAAGTIAALGGLVGVIMTTRKLNRKKKERQRIQREIMRLQRALPPEPR